MIEYIENNLGLDVFYKYKKRKYDCKHIIFVFSGFGGGNEGVYDFENALADCPSHVVWIKDFFYGMATYYLFHSMNNIENSIINFIKNFITKCNLGIEDCTFTGFSKGGTAALYYGTKLGCRNIVVTVPQFFIGSYVSKNWTSVAHHMMGNVNEEKIKLLDSLLIDLIDKDKICDRNIYLITSKSDIQYPIEIEPNLHRFLKYKNFNLLLGCSLLINEHKQVTPYHVPLLLGIFYSLSQGAIPQFGYCEMRGDETLPSKEKKIRPVAILRKAMLDNVLFFPEGISFIRGVQCPEYRDISVKMIMENDEISYGFLLGKQHLSDLTRKVYDGEYINYDKGGFSSPKHNGLDLTDLRHGIFTVYLEIRCGGLTVKTELKVSQNMDDKILCENDTFRVYSENKMVYIQTLLQSNVR